VKDVSNPRIKNILESLLFVSNKPLTPEELAPIIGIPENLILAAFEELVIEFENKGIQVVKVAGGWQIVTRVENAEYVDKLLNSPIVTTLSPAALESLAIIAYKQPVTRLEIENIRGVMSDGVVKTLLDKRMIREVGKSDSVGRPILYGTTIEFLRHFGLKDLGDLPALPEGSLEQARAFHDGGVLPKELVNEQLQLDKQVQEENVAEGETV